MASRGRGRRERPRGNGQAQSVFDQRTFAEAVGVVTPRPGRVYSTTTVGAYKSSKCRIVVFWRLK